MYIKDYKKDYQVLFNEAYGVIGLTNLNLLFSFERLVRLRMKMCNEQEIQDIEEEIKGIREELFNKLNNSR